MKSAGSILRPVAVLSSVLLVIILGILAVLNIRSTDGSEEDEIAQEELAPASPNTPSGSERIVLGDSQSSVSVACGTVGAEGYAVTIRNEGSDDDDFVIAVSMTVDDGDDLALVAEAPVLGSGEERELSLPTAGRSVSDCVVTAVEADRRVFLTGQ